MVDERNKNKKYAVESAQKHFLKNKEEKYLGTKTSVREKKMNLSSQNKERRKFDSAQSDNFKGSESNGIDYQEKSDFAFYKEKVETDKISLNKKKENKKASQKKIKEHSEIKRESNSETRQEKSSLFSKSMERKTSLKTDDEAKFKSKSLEKSNYQRRRSQKEKASEREKLTEDRSFDNQKEQRIKTKSNETPNNSSVSQEKIKHQKKVVRKEKDSKKTKSSDEKIHSQNDRRGEASFQSHERKNDNISEPRPRQNRFDRYRDTRQKVKEGKENLGYKGQREKRLDSKAELKNAKKDLKSIKKESPTDKEALIKAKQRKTVAKKVNKEAVKQTGGTIKGRLGKATVRQAHLQTREQGEDAARGDDTLQDLAGSRQKIRSLHNSKYHIENNTRRVKDIGSFAGRKVYGLGNRGFNAIRGQGFVRTPEQLSKPHQAMRRARMFKIRVKKSKVGQTTSFATRTLKFLTKPGMAFVKNPLSIGGIIGIMLTLFVVVAIMAVMSSSTTYQSEFELSDSWKLMSIYDREKSDDDADYYTDLDDVMLFTNSKDEDYNIWQKKDYKVESGDWITKSGRYADYLEVLWNKLNGDTTNLKSMEDVYSDEKNLDDFAFKKEEKEDYADKMSLISEDGAGRYPHMLELDNPLYLSNDEVNYNSPLKIVKRYGADSKDNIFNGMTIQANQGQAVYASLDGKVNLDTNGTTVRIYGNSKTYLSYTHLTDIKVKEDQEVKKGDLIGYLKKENLTLYYRKYREEEDVTRPMVVVSKNLKLVGGEEGWTYVNPGFYFNQVVYLQTTSVMSSLSGDAKEKADKVKGLILKYFPEATDKGIAAVLGNWEVESSVTAKRAEADYLNPPVGASGNCWDDDAWLNMGSAEIYNGRYPNIVHRGLGLGQWTDTADGGIRNTLLRNFAKEKGKKWYDLELQIDFMFNGDNPGNIATAKAILSSNDDVASLTNSFLVYWEGNPGNAVKQRQNAAEQMYLLLTIVVGGGSMDEIPAGYEDKVKPKPTGAVAPGNGYPFGQCTWGAYNRLRELGKNSVTSVEGNGGSWWQGAMAKGLPVSKGSPKKHDAVSFPPGVAASDPFFGHVAVVEYVNPDGSILISEANADGKATGKITWRIISSNDVKNSYFIDYE